jgi:GNAT superfamily N-acetyltransferase
VAERQGKVLGYLLAPWRATQPPPLSVLYDEFYLHDLAVSSKARGLGVGQRLLVALSRAMLDIAMQAWWRFRMPRLLAQAGFVPADTGKSLVEYGDGAVYMRLPWQTAVPNREPSAEFNKEFRRLSAPFSISRCAHGEIKP